MSHSVREYYGRLWIFMHGVPYRVLDLSDPVDYQLAAQALGTTAVERYK